MSDQIILALIILALLWAVLSIHVADHAMARGKSGLWGLAVFCTGVFGLAFYAISVASE